MSVSLPDYNPEYCDGNPCPHDCEHCPERWELRDLDDDENVEIDISNSPYAEWLESFVRSVLDFEPDSIGVAMSRKSDDYVMTAYYRADANDKSTFIENIRSDWVLDIIESNASRIRNMLIEAENDYLEDENDGDE